MTDTPTPETAPTRPLGYWLRVVRHLTRHELRATAAEQGLDRRAAAASLRERIAAAVPEADYITTVRTLEAIARELGGDDFAEKLPRGKHRRRDGHRHGSGARGHGFGEHGFGPRYGFDGHGFDGHGFSEHGVDPRHGVDRHDGNPHRGFGARGFGRCHGRGTHGLDQRDGFGGHHHSHPHDDCRGEGRHDGAHRHARHCC